MLVVSLVLHGLGVDRVERVRPLQRARRHGLVLLVRDPGVLLVTRAVVIRRLLLLLAVPVEGRLVTTFRDLAMVKTQFLAPTSSRGLMTFGSVHSNHENSIRSTVHTSKTKPLYITCEFRWYQHG